jgi:hypothetical protein
LPDPSIVARRGHLEIPQWVRENGFEWSEGTCASAAERGDLELLRWAGEHGCPWDKNTCTEAASNGHREKMGFFEPQRGFAPDSQSGSAFRQWAREHGCPWSEVRCLKAAQKTDIRRRLGFPAIVFFFPRIACPRKRPLVPENCIETAAVERKIASPAFVDTTPDQLEAYRGPW